ncbi:hypothetical protein GOV13_04105 [Candidatus Pacearchaeota archaeon]|nr:hypothetical protein [Candidatus Pacearchaeota archaeon]
MPNEEITPILESIGLSKNEIIVYLELISVGKSSAGDISKGTKIHRPNVYDILEKLIQKGIVNQGVENDRKVFYPIPPKNLLDYFNQKAHDLEKIIPKMEEIHSKPKKSETKIISTEGVQSIRTTMSDLLELNSQISTYGIPKEAVEILGGFIHEFHKKRISKGIIMKHIYNLDATKRIKELTQMPHTEARYLPSLYNTKINTIICGNKIMFFLWEPPFTTIIIENESLAKAYQNYFEILWEEARITYS